MMAEVTLAIDEFGRDPDVRAVVVHGAGRAFSAGFDLKESLSGSKRTTEALREVLETDLAFILQFWDCPKPIIAAVHGYCLAGAFELALACDMTVADEGTRLGEPEVRFGSGMVALLLPWMTSPKLAKELLLTGNDKLDARRGYEMGIINAVVPEGEHLDTAVTAARKIAAAAPAAVQLTKRAINRGYEMAGLRQALTAALDIDVLIESSGGAEKAEFNRLRQEKGLKAALEWRDARFRDPGR
jgi:enoyl-CoA hydratase